MFSIKIISPEDTVFTGDVDFAVLPGSLGQLGILPNHSPLFSTLKPGQIRVRQSGAIKTFESTGGFVEVLRSKVTVLLYG